MYFAYAPCNLYMHFDPFSGPKNDVFGTPKSIKLDSKTRSETKMFLETLLVPFLVRFGTPWGALWGPKSDAIRTKKRTKNMMKKIRLKNQNPRVKILTNSHGGCPKGAQRRSPME